MSALLKKLEIAEEKLKFKLGHFRGVAHESASGELASSELKVFEDYVSGLRKEVETLQKRLSLDSRGPKV